MTHKLVNGAIDEKPYAEVRGGVSEAWFSDRHLMESQIYELLGRFVTCFGTLLALMFSEDWNGKGLIGVKEGKRIIGTLMFLWIKMDMNLISQLLKPATKITTQSEFTSNIEKKEKKIL